MARKPRIHVAGGTYHVILRGNGGQPIFFGDEDRYHLYLLLQEGSARFDYRVHAFCCMGNHLHFALQVGEIPLSKSMQNLAFRYTRWVNRREKRLGHLFQGRYRALLIERDNYLLELVRYIHLNPVRGGLVTQPEAYPWSAHKAYLGEETLPWLTTDWVLSQFGKRVSTARRGYEAFVKQGYLEGYREEFHRGVQDARILGGDHFVEQTLSQLGEPPSSVPSLDKLVQTVCQDFGLEEAALCNPSQQRMASQARAIIGWLAVQVGIATLTEVGQRFHRDVSTLSAAVRRLTIRAQNVPPLQERLARLRKQIMLGN
jgi:putative transposase